MTYTVKEIFYTLQGEGANAGSAAVFCRFSGCNLWSGREEDRPRAVCQFCDTDFVGTGPDGGRFESAAALAAAIANAWRGNEAEGRKLVVCTGGEPLLQLDEPLIEAIHSFGFKIAIETNGTRHAPESIDWICVSPKARAPLVQKSGNELKLVFPQPGAMPEMFESLAFEHFFIQPMDGPDISENTRTAIDYCMTHPKWRLSLQTHKQLGIR
jgi:7-carboxy-7-deazaguanine synthase (Cx14CxxC type)